MRRVLGVAAWALGILAFLLLVAWWLAGPATPGEFYAAPERLPPNPGTLLREEPFSRGIPVGAVGRRILYTTTRDDGSGAVASAIVISPANPGDEPRPLITWTHGTTGIVPGCAPSLLRQPFEELPLLKSVTDRGWIVVAPDYIGLGTPGPHPYLIGSGEARSTLDSVRAIRQVSGIRIGDRTVVWGHSQGGNAAMWTGILGPTYAPDVKIAGVVAMAPASDLPALVVADQYSLIGRLLSTYILQGFSDYYPDVDFNMYSTLRARPFAHDIPRRCLVIPEGYLSVGESIAARPTIFRVSPDTGALGRHLAENSPDRPISQPLVIAQGMTDDLVPPDIQTRFVRKLCANGQSLSYWRYAGRSHGSVIAPDSPFVPQLFAWTQDRFAGAPSASGCTEIAH